MPTYYPISLDEMNSHLLNQGFRPVSAPRIREAVYGKRVDVDGVQMTLRVFSGIQIESQNSRSCGSDAIRVCIVHKKSDGKIVGIKRGDKKVYRTRNWRKNLDSLISGMIPSSAYVQDNGWVKVA